MPTILVVDDEPTIVGVVKDLLEEEGYDVVTAGNGREGLACVAEVHPQLVLSDVMMPVLDGHAFCRALQADPALRPIPVVLMSAAAPTDARDGCAYAAFMHKPFDLNILLDTVAVVLARATGRPQER